ncbi:SEC-C metal-binding domain-containing protein [Halobacillus salinus]|uniref:SEC-C metal-binding domain-containing protein n=1 Tax=Halobacillus salinus TaxID=192814 RepID=UPI0009A5BA40|nr:SEC-C metal-binding domain-containing protein [Halobacillus salinus]
MNQHQWKTNIEAYRQRERQREKQAFRAFWRHDDTVSTLKECLQRLTKGDLDEIRKFYQFQGLSQLSKQDLVDVLSDRIPDEFKNALELLDEKRYHLILELAESGGRVSAESYSHSEALHLAKSGLAFPVTHDGEYRFVLPDELIEAFHKADTPVMRKKAALNTEYVLLMNGMLHYYGFMQTDDVIEALASYTGETVDKGRLADVLELVPEYEKDFEYDYSMSGYNDLMADEPHKIERGQKARPELGFYPFSKQELLETGRDSSKAISQKMREFKRVVDRNYDIEEDHLEDLGFEMETAIRNGIDTQTLLDELQQWIEIPDEQMLGELIPPLMQAHNDTRMYDLKGYKPTELIEQERGALNPLPTNAVPMKLNKVGRNEPCSCGSGKKYKKCCGK